jgi:hypothetical protein
MEGSEKNSNQHHKEILGTSLYTGGAQAVTSVTNLLRVKFVAVFLGVTGFGLRRVITPGLDFNSDNNWNGC